MTLQLSFLGLVSFLLVSNLEGFAPLSVRTSASTSVSPSTQNRIAFAVTGPVATPPSALWAEAEEAAEGESAEEAAADEEKEAPPAQDPELTALKEEIAKFEAQLADKQRALQTVLDGIENYSKKGFTRKVAQIENLRRNQESMAASSLDNAAGGVLKDFLPALDKLKVQKAQYIDSEFGQNYAGLTGAMEGALQSMGLQEFTAETGEPVVAGRIEVVQSVHSDEAEADTVIECVVNGYKVKEGTILRPAGCVVSLGKEPEGEVVEEEQEPAAADEAEEPAAE